MTIETMTKLASYTVTASGGDTSVTFSNIPQTYTDLKLVYSTRGDRGGANGWETSTRIQFGTSTLDTGANYNDRAIFGYGGSVTGGSDTASTYLINYTDTTGPITTASTFGSSEVYMPNYTSSNYKAVSMEAVDENNSSSASLSFGTGIWLNTNPIQMITLTPNSGTIYAQYSSFTLYGIKAMRTAVGNSIKATGGVLSFDGTYVYHSFSATGAFTPSANLVLEYLIVGGGGGGGADQGGGGGAGGYKTGSGILATSGTGYAITVGSGGNGGIIGPTVGSNGSSSTAFSLTAGGGYGGGVSYASGGNVGSGDNSSYTGGITYGDISGGGGGAGVAGNGGNASSSGKNSPSGYAGIGGVGTTLLGVTFGGGGGGGNRTTTQAGTASFGGGAGGYQTVGSPASANTGSGGGGGSWNSTFYAGGNGGSGIVVVRYKA